MLLLPGFSLLAEACATEPLAVANQLAGRPLYSVALFGPEGEPVTSGSRQWLQTQRRVGDDEALDMLMVCAAGLTGASDPLLGWLRRLAGAGSVMVGIDGGAELLGRAGLLDGYRATLPWQRFEAMARDHPRVRLSRHLFEIDRDRLTCGGGTAAMDMMMTLIGSQHGSELAERVSAHFVLERVRMGDEPQRAPLRSRLGRAPESLVEAVSLMEANIEEPLTTHELAEHLGISRRQLERQFKKHLQAVPSRYYLGLRLQRARRLLREGDHAAGEVGMLTGFSSAAHFSTAYRNHFGVTPREERLD